MGELVGLVFVVVSSVGVGELVGLVFVAVSSVGVGELLGVVVLVCSSGCGSGGRTWGTGIKLKANAAAAKLDIPRVAGTACFNTA